MKIQMLVTRKCRERGKIKPYVKGRGIRYQVIFVAVLLIVIFAYFFIGNYFYNLAINRYSDKSSLFGDEEIEDFEENKNYMNASGMHDTWIENEGYQLHAYETNTESNLWIVVVHGYTSEGIHMVDAMRHFYESGYNVLALDLRGHGKSDGDQIGMGSWDSRDLLMWVNYIVEKEPDCMISLYGVSMGAATVMLTGGMAELPDHVKSIVEDSGYTSVWSEFAYKLKQLYGLPAFPFLDAANTVVKIKAGYNLKSVNPMEAVKIKTRPMLFIHGDADDFIPVDMVYELYAAASEEKELMIIENSAHAKGRNDAKEQYWSGVDSFIQKYFEHNPGSN